MRGDGHGRDARRVVARPSRWSARAGFATRARQLSGGQQQRVALARALVIGPACCCSTSRCPTWTRSCASDMREEMRALQRTLGITTMSVTHDQEEALALADRVVVMNRGAHRAGRGAERGLYERPANRFVAEFIGQCNLFEGTLVARADVTECAE